MTTYLAGSALDELDRAQAIIDRHLTACLVCGTNKPCHERREAEGVFSRYERLPRRKPGLVGGAATPAAFGWFGGSPATTDVA